MAIYRLPRPFHDVEITRTSPPVPDDDLPVPGFGSMVLPAAGTVAPFALPRRRTPDTARRTA